MHIQGTITFINIGVGFWGLISDDNQKWQIVNMPLKLQQEGLKVSLKVEKLDGVVSNQMWGTLVKIV